METRTEKFVRLFGSWRYLSWYLLFVCAWVVWNLLQATPWHFDGYPCQFLNLVLAVLAGVQAPIILIAQAKQDRHRDEILAHLTEMEERILDAVKK
jgi:uncharacterized membrane protein